LYVNYKTFVGAANFINHVQILDKAVGFVADAVLRRILVDKEANVFVYYVDILIATHQDFKELCDNILLNKVQYLSMGCETYVSQCSRCGEVFTGSEDSDVDYCEHLTLNRGKYFIDDMGNKRMIAELNGTGEPGSCVFIEASWLTAERPAFKGAALRHPFMIPAGVSIKIEVPGSFLERDAPRLFLGL
jgi:hypothetical protein